MRTCVIGGAGYIGSHMVQLLAEKGHEVVTLDNLTSGRREAVLSGDLVVGDAGDRTTLDRLFAKYQIDAVFHFASHIEVGESVVDPAKYYRNNVSTTVTLLEAMVAHGITRFIFSSTAAVFGVPQALPIAEDHPCVPINPYGRSKRMVEELLQDFDAAYGLKSICFRYFNAAGADPEARLGECHDPESHLIPLVLKAAAGRLPCIRIFGHSHATPDGTCVRDYIHVTDLCSAHLLGLQWLRENNVSQVFNLGNGSGYSVQEVIEAAKRVTGCAIRVEEGDARPGDPPTLVANAARAYQVLGWQPQRAALETMIEDAWRWEKKRNG